MLRHKIALGLVVCLFTAGWVGQTLCQTQGPAQPRSRPDSRQSQQLLLEQKKKEFERQTAEKRERQDRWMAERRKEFEQQARDSANGKNQRRNEFIKHTLALTEEQWKVIEPKINKVYFLADQAGIKIEFSGGGGGFGAGAGSGTSVNPAGGATSTGTGTNGWQTVQSSTSSSTVSGGGGGGGAGSGVGQGWSGPLWRLADRELTEGEKTCEELLLLLEDKNSKQADVDQKVDVLRRARENAAKELTKARQELREVLTVRQQARLVLMGVLD